LRQRRHRLEGDSLGVGPAAEPGLGPPHPEAPGARAVVLAGPAVQATLAPTVESLLAKAHRALRPGGQLAIYEILRSSLLGNPLPVVLAGWEIIIGAPGEIRTAGVYREMLARAGFGPVRSTRSPDVVGFSSLITASKT